MRQVGEVVYADVFLDDQGRSKGGGIVEFASQQEAQRAIQELNDSRIGQSDRPIFIREDREDRGSAQGRRRGPRRPQPASGGLGKPSLAGRQLFIGNLPWSTTWMELKDIFRRVGDVQRADVLTGRDGRSRGQGIVVMSTEEDAERAILQLNRYMVGDRPIEVHLDKYA